MDDEPYRKRVCLPFRRVERLSFASRSIHVIQGWDAMLFVALMFFKNVETDLVLTFYYLCKEQ